MERRGSALDVILIGVVVFVFAIAFLVMHFTANKIYDGMLQNPVINSSSKTVGVLESSKHVTDKLDYWSLGVFIGLLMAIIITGWYISANPLFMGLYVVVVIIAVIASMILSNVWETFSQRPVFVQSVASLPITNHLLNYLPYYVAVAGIIGIIVVFAKPGFNAGGDLRVG